MAQLSRGSIRSLNSGATIDPPTLQVSIVKTFEYSSYCEACVLFLYYSYQILTVKSVPPNRYQVLLTDGAETTTGMLASQLNNKVTEGVLGENAVIKITKHIKSNISGQT